jgi:flagellar hook-associated protein 2
MINFNGLVSGLDTSTIIDGLLQIQQRQVAQQNARRASVLTKQSAFGGVEARLSSFRGALSRLSSLGNSALRGKIASSSDEDILTATANSKATNGTYKLKVTSLATAHTLSSQTFASDESELALGTLTLQVGSGTAVNIAIDSSNNSLNGLAEAINNSDAGVNASVIRDESSATKPYRLLLTSKNTGEDYAITVSSRFDEPSGSQETITINTATPVQAAADAVIEMGSGAGKITAKSSTNRFDKLIAGVTIDANLADATKEITLNVTADTDKAADAVNEFVEAYNDLNAYVTEQTRYTSATGRAGLLLGDRSVTAIQAELQQSLTTGVEGLTSEANRLSAVGITFDDKGNLEFDESKLRDALNGQVSGIDPSDVARLFSLGADSTSFGVEFVVGSSRTKEGSVSVDITSAAERANITGTALASSIVVNGTNNTLNISVDGTASSPITLRSGTYTQAEYAQLVQDAINANETLGGRDVSVKVSGGSLRIETVAYGSTAKLGSLSGSALTSMGFTGSENDIGQDVVGKFTVDGRVETATGRGNILVGDKDNEATADLQVRVTLETADLVAGAEATVTVTRGYAARLDLAIAELSDDDTSLVANANKRFTDTAESIQKSIDRLNARFEAQKESLLKQFTALENVLGQLQTTGNFIGAQLASLG